MLYMIHSIEVLINLRMSLHRLLGSQLERKQSNQVKEKGKISIVSATIDINKDIDTIHIYLTNTLISYHMLVNIQCVAATI